MTYKPVSMKRLLGTEPRGMRIVSNYQSEPPAKRRVAQLRKQGYKAKYEVIMGNYSVWVSPRYFKDHPKAKRYLGKPIV